MLPQTCELSTNRPKPGFSRKVSVRMLQLCLATSILPARLVPHIKGCQARAEVAEKDESQGLAVKLRPVRGRVASLQAKTAAACSRGRTSPRSPRLAWLLLPRRQAAFCCLLFSSGRHRLVFAFNTRIKPKELHFTILKWQIG